MSFYAHSNQPSFLDMSMECCSTCPSQAQVMRSGSAGYHETPCTKSMWEEHVYLWGTLGGWYMTTYQCVWPCTIHAAKKNQYWMCRWKSLDVCAHRPITWDTSGIAINDYCKIIIIIIRSIHVCSILGVGDSNISVIRNSGQQTSYNCM